VGLAQSGELTQHSTVADGFEQEGDEQHLFEVLRAVLVGFVLRHAGLQPEVRAVVFQVLIWRQPVLQGHPCQHNLYITARQ